MHTVTSCSISGQLKPYSSPPSSSLPLSSSPSSHHDAQESLLLYKVNQLHLTNKRKYIGSIEIYTYCGIHCIKYIIIQLVVVSWISFSSSIMYLSFLSQACIKELLHEIMIQIILKLRQTLLHANQIDFLCCVSLSSLHCSCSSSYIVLQGFCTSLYLLMKLFRNIF